MTTHITKTEEETKKLASEFARELKGGEVVKLIGGLGSGKTTFVRGVAEALGASVRVKSPTFTIMNEYPTSHQKIKRIIHIDLYRFTDSKELEALELDDFIKSDAIVFIEWPDIIKEPFFEDAEKVEFEFVDENTRTISF